MNGRLAKKIRAAANKAAMKRDEKILPDLKMFINAQLFGSRLVLAWRLLWRRF